MSRKEELLKELADIEKSEKKLKRDKYVRKLEDVTNEEKINFYDMLFNQALNFLKSQEKDFNCEPETQYSWEEQMSMLEKPGEDFWQYYNNLEE